MAKNIAMGVIVGLIVGGVAGFVFGNQAKAKPEVIGISEINQKELALQNGMRKLWEDHVVWTRLYIVEAVHGTKGAGDSAARLLRNQEDIGNAIRPYYGDDAGKKLTALLKEHIAGAVEVLTAAKAGDSKKVETASAKWYKNGNDIAAFLSNANPQNWPSMTMREGMKMHLDMTLKEAVAELQGKYNESIEDYDRVHDHILGLADFLSRGIVVQFPDRF